VHDWQARDAKIRFSEVVKRAPEDGPQTVTVHGKRAAVVISASEFDALVKPRMPFVDFLLSDPPGIEAWPDNVVDAINDRSPYIGRGIALSIALHQRDDGGADHEGYHDQGAQRPAAGGGLSALAGRTVFCVFRRNSADR
jgi:prevent-host-death family protein